MIHHDQHDHPFTHDCPCIKNKSRHGTTHTQTHTHTSSGPRLQGASSPATGSSRPGPLAYPPPPPRERRSPSLPPPHRSRPCRHPRSIPVRRHRRPVLSRLCRCRKARARAWRAREAGRNGSPTWSNRRCPVVRVYMYVYAKIVTREEAGRAGR